MTRKLRLYGGNFDGTNEAIVAAPNQKEAARALGCSLYSFNLYGRQLNCEARLAVAMQAPGRVFERKYEVTRGRFDESGWEMQPERGYVSRQSKPSPASAVDPVNPPLRLDLQGRRLTRCQSDDDDYCVWEHCPQLRDDEPEKCGRHCPLDISEGVDE